MRTKRKWAWAELAVQKKRDAINARRALGCMAVILGRQKRGSRGTPVINRVLLPLAANLDRVQERLNDPGRLGLIGGDRYDDQAAGRGDGPRVNVLAELRLLIMEVPPLRTPDSDRLLADDLGAGGAG